MEKIKLPPIDYKVMAEDIEAAEQERTGIDTGRFTPFRHVDSEQSKDARTERE